MADWVSDNFAIELSRIKGIAAEAAPTVLLMAPVGAASAAILLVLDD